MSKKMMRLVAAVLLLVTCTATAHAAPGSFGGAGDSFSLATLWERLEAWLGSADAVQMEGPSMDPNGKPTTNGAANGDAGPSMDPNG